MSDWGISFVSYRPQSPINTKQEVHGPAKKLQTIFVWSFHAFWIVRQLCYITLQVRRGISTGAQMVWSCFRPCYWGGTSLSPAIQSGKLGRRALQYTKSHFVIAFTSPNTISANPMALYKIHTHSNDNEIIISAGNVAKQSIVALDEFVKMFCLVVVNFEIYRRIPQWMI